MSRQNPPVKIAFFLATSGHSGVDRAMNKLIPEICKRGFAVDLLQVENHGPHIDGEIENLRRVPLARSHTMTCLRPLVAYLKAEKPEVLFADKDRANRVALLAKYLARSPVRVVVRSGTIMSINLKQRSLVEVLLHKLSMNFLYSLAHGIVVPSRYAADDLAAISRIARDDIEVVPFPVVDDGIRRLSQQPLAHPWFAEKNLPVIVAVGELNPRKDHATLLLAFARVNKVRPCRLVIVGKGKSRAYLLQLIDELGLADCVDLVGFQKNPYHYMARADLFVHSATFEGFGMVLIEALYLQTPVVATDCMGGPREILGDGEHGQLVPVGDDEAMARAVLYALENSDNIANTTDFAKAVERYPLQSSADEHLRVMGLSNSYV